MKEAQLKELGKICYGIGVVIFILGCIFDSIISRGILLSIYLMICLILIKYGK